MTTIQPVLPIANTAPASAAGGGKSDASAADFLSLVVDAAGEEAAPAEGEGIAGPLVEKTEDTLSQSTGSLLALEALPEAMPDLAATAEIDPEAVLDAQALPVALPATLPAQAAMPDDALAAASKAKAASDALLLAQTPAIEATAEALPVEDAPVDPSTLAATASEKADAKAQRDSTSALPGGFLSMTETPEAGAETLPAALAFRKALEQRTETARTREAPVEQTRNEGAANGADGRITNTDASLRSAPTPFQTAPLPAEGATDAKPLDPLAPQTGGDATIEALLGAKTGDAKHTAAGAALTAVKGVLVNPQAVVAQVAVQLTAAGQSKTQAMTVKLEPVELGKIDIRLDFGTDGKVQASIIADRPQTLDMLQRDARGLEKALQNAGLQTDSGSLSFNLRGQDRQQTQDGSRPAFSADAEGDAVFGNETFSVIAGQPRTAPLGRVDMLL